MDSLLHWVIVDLDPSTAGVLAVLSMILLICHIYRWRRLKRQQRLRAHEGSAPRPDAPGEAG